ncbi:hypothetical protein [Desulfoscipio gibsoniae]|uniref:Uncharacterized protein n=1 Tax=Desulfoscipio gibsoniae DSM 7213 TaxID=767817 RepID=R4KHN5_9FIRM|nr:hypothetical protein [Desulfoscipio gibsoniae]AGL02124.1 hypothetical protein Desgi_2720 [Desulfoscipio gibsoniae DSM 7213]
MNNHPLLLVQRQSEPISNTGEEEIIAIAVYGNGVDVPISVSTQRVFAGEKPFRFPTEITKGATKTRIVYRYTVAQWHELLETTTLSSSAESLKQLMIPMLLHMKQSFPDVFEDIAFDCENSADQYAELIIMD